MNNKQTKRNDVLLFSLKHRNLVTECPRCLIAVHS